VGGWSETMTGMKERRRNNDNEREMRLWGYRKNERKGVFRDRARARRFHPQQRGHDLRFG